MTRSRRGEGRLGGALAGLHVGQAAALHGLDDGRRVLQGDAAQLEVGARGDVTDALFVSIRLQQAAQHAQLAGGDLAVGHLRGSRGRRPGFSAPSALLPSKVSRLATQIGV